MPKDIRDITIIGGGPTGLFGAFYAGMRGMSTRIIDSLPELGGQVMALYPEKHIFDVGGIPKILGKDFVQDIITQGTQFSPDVVLDEEVATLTRDKNYFVLKSKKNEYLTRSVLIAGGKGAFEPRPLKCPGYENLLGKGVHYAVNDPDEYLGKKILLVGGGDSALDWALSLKDRASQITMIHRRDSFRAYQSSIDELYAASEAGKIDLRTFFEVREIHGKKKVKSVTIYDNRTDEDMDLDVDAVLCFLGFKPDLGPIKSWDLKLSGKRIVVNQLMQTSILGIYAAGDLVSYPGKLDLIATGYGEAAIAVNNAVNYLDPGARVNPGHSTNLSIFKDK
jgi:thioredoxin reductase